MSRKRHKDKALPVQLLHTLLFPDKVTELLDLCLRSTYFSYGGDFYEQQEGAVMGSPVSAAVANLYMEFFEDLALSQAPTDCTPRMWKRYVDDTFCTLKKGTVEELLSHLNSLRPTIQFTVEVEEDGSLPFLDILLQKWSAQTPACDAPLSLRGQ